MPVLAQPWPTATRKIGIRTERKKVERIVFFIEISSHQLRTNTHGGPSAGVCYCQAVQLRLVRLLYIFHASEERNTGVLFLLKATLGFTLLLCTK
jgi:hypothetical protein